MSNTVDAVQSFISTLQSSLAAVPQELEQAAPTGDFAAVFAGVEAEFAAGPLASTTTSTTTSTTASDTSAAGQVEEPSEDSSTGSPDGAQVVAEAEQFLGVPYVWGGSTPAGFDCSGFTQYVYGQLGMSLPRTAAEQSSVGTPVASLADAEPGDLVFFAGADGTPTAPGHVGIYLGNGEMIDAPETGENVSIEAVGDPVAIRRVLPDSDPTPPPVASSLSVPSSTAPSTPSYTVPAALAPDFLSAAATYHVPVTLLTAVAYEESGFDPTATSSAGAEGVMQLMPSTAAGLGVNPLDPAQAIDGAAQLLSSYLAQYGSVPLALAAYNAGPAAVAAAGNAVPDFAQTKAYVSNILSLIGQAAA